MLLEMRDREWAEAREKLMVDLLAPSLQQIPGNPALTSIDCRTSSCEMEVEIDKDHIDDALATLPALEPGDAFGMQIGGTIGSRSLLRLDVLFSPEHRDEQSYLAWRKRRLQTEEQAK